MIITSLEKGDSFIVHHYNIQTLSTELYKGYHNIAQTVFSDLFITNNNVYNLRAKSDFAMPQIKAVLKGSNSIQYHGPVIWNFSPAEMKYVDSFETYKSQIRMWKLNTCPCRICKNYILNVSFLETFE